MEETVKGQIMEPRFAGRGSRVADNGRPLSNLLLIYPPKIRNHRNPRKINTLEISNLSASRLNAFQPAISFASSASVLIYGTGIRNPSNSLKTQGRHHV